MYVCALVCDGEVGDVRLRCAGVVSLLCIKVRMLGGHCVRRRLRLF